MTFSTEMLACFTLAREANVKVASLVYVREQLFLEEPVGDLPIALVMMSIIFCLAAESRMISAIDYTSRDDVETVMATMKTAFDRARDLASEIDDPSPYQTLTALAGSLTNFLSDTARPLPRMVTFKMKAIYPSLALSQRLYYDPGRSEEIAQENHTIYPAFCQLEIRGLAS